MTFTTFPHQRVNIGGDTHVFSYSNIEKNKITVTSANVIDPIHQLGGFIHCEHKLRNLSAFSEIAPGDVIFIGFLVSSPPLHLLPTCVQQQQLPFKKTWENSFNLPAVPSKQIHTLYAKYSTTQISDVIMNGVSIAKGYRPPTRKDNCNSQRELKLKKKKVN